MKKQLLIVVSMICLVACTTNNAPLNNEQIDAIKAEAKTAIANFIDAIEKNQEDVIIASFHNSDATIVVFGDEAHNYTGFLELANSILPNVDHQVMDTKSEIITVASSDCFIHYWTGFNGMYFKDGTHVEMENFFLTYVYKKIDGEWKIIHAHESWQNIPMPVPDKEMLMDQ